MLAIVFVVTAVVTGVAFWRAERRWHAEDAAWWANFVAKRDAARWCASRTAPSDLPDSLAGRWTRGGDA